MKSNVKFNIVDAPESCYLECNGGWDIGYFRSDMKKANITEKDVINEMETRVKDTSRNFRVEFKAPKQFELAWNDLTPEAQKRLLTLCATQENDMSEDDIKASWRARSNVTAYLKEWEDDNNDQK